MIVTSDPLLTFGAVNLIGTEEESVEQGFRFEALGTDTSWGNPVPIDIKVISWLQDGALVARKGYDNRQMNIQIRMAGEDSDSLAVAEEMLTAEVGKRNLLTWTPPDGKGEPCVFSVVMSTLNNLWDDEDELRNERLWGLEIQAEPFVSAADITTVTVPAPSGTPDVSVIDDCTSYTGWTAGWTGSYYPGGGFTYGTTGGSVYLQGTYVLSAGHLRLMRSGLTADITTSPYIRVTAAVSNGLPLPVFKLFSAAIPAGVVVPVVLQEGQAYWFDTTGLGLGSEITGVEVLVSFTAIQSGYYFNPRLSISDVSESNVLGTQETNRQLARTIAVVGSMRTQGNLALVDESAALGSVLVHTMPAVPGLVQPNIRRYLTSGNSETPDADTVSGFSSDLSALHTFDIPASGFISGGHLLLARIMNLSAGPDTKEFQTLTWAAKSRMGSTNLAGGEDGETTVTLPLDEYAIVTLADLNLPTRQLGADGLVRIELTATPNTLLDEVWLFNLETGRLTQVECGTGTPTPGGAANRLFLDAPTVEWPSQAVYLATEADRSDQFHAGPEMDSFMLHEFVPKATNVFTVTTGSTESEITMSHYRRGHTHIARLA